MLTTHDNRLGYWLVGFALIWLLLPVDLVDIMIDPTWYAPNPQCDSLGVPILQVRAVLGVWTVIAALISGGAVLLVRRRISGIGVFRLRLGTTYWNLVITLIAIAIIAPAMFDIIRRVWQAIVPQMISEDCGGYAELVIVNRRAPMLQFTPLLELGVVLWILHIRALLLSPRVP